MIFVDSNIPMYIIGAAHPLKSEARRLADRAVDEGVTLLTDAEAFQEILHRYSAIGRQDAIRPAFNVMLELVEEVVPVALPDVEAARDLLTRHPRLTARDALHLAVMTSLGVSRILTFDTAFDEAPGVTRYVG